MSGQLTSAGDRRLEALAASARGPRRNGLFALWMFVRACDGVLPPDGLSPRAHRRRLELKAMGIERDERELEAELVARDAADRARPVSPLRQAADAALLDTSNLGIDAAFAAALALVQSGVENALQASAKG